MKAIIARGVKSVARLLEVLIGSGSSGVGAFFGGLRQAVENAVDAGASTIHLELDRRSKTIRITDDGRGFGAKEFAGFLSLCVSPKEGLKGLIGKNGSGRIFLLQVGGTISVYSTSAEVPGITHFSLSRTDLEELMEKEHIDREIEMVPKPAWWKLTGTGSVIVIEGVDWKKVPAPSEVIARFASHLRPSIARKVFVNGQPLQPRAVVGEVIHETIRVPYLEEPVEVELFVPKARSSTDTVRLGAFNPISPLRDFVNELPTELRGIIPVELLSGIVCGDIFIPQLNNHRAHDGRSFEETLFQDHALVEGIARFLAEEVGPRVNKAFARKREAEETQAREEFVSDLCDAVNPAFGFDPDEAPRLGPDSAPEGDKRPGGIKPLISVNNRQITLLPGQRHTFRVTRLSGTSGKFLWDDAGSGGSIDNRRTSEVTYTAGMKLGRYELIVRDRNALSRFAKISIRIVGERSLMISPVRIDIPAGEEQEFSVRNHEFTTAGNIRWTLPGNPAGITLSAEEGLKVIVKTSKETVRGNFTLTAFDADEPEEGLRAEATFEVVEPEHELGNTLRIEDKYYVLEISTTLSTPGSMVERRKGARLDTRADGGTTIDALSMDLGHPVFAALAKISGTPEARMQALLPHLVAAHLQGLVEDGKEAFDEVSFRGRMMALITRIMETRVDASDGDDGAAS